MHTKRLPIKGRRVYWDDENLGVIREEGGIAIINTNDLSIKVVGGFLNFKHMAWSNNGLAAATRIIVMLYDKEGELYKAIKSSDEITALSSATLGYVIGTESGVLSLITGDGKKIWENKVWDGRIDRIEESKSGFLLVVVDKYTLLILSPEGKLITTNSYRWDMRKVAWNEDMSLLGVPSDGNFLIYKWVEGQGYVKDTVIRERVIKAKWCDDYLGILGYNGFKIVDKTNLRKVKYLIRVSGKDFDWSKGCRSIALLCENSLYILEDLNSTTTNMSLGST